MILLYFGDFLENPEIAPSSDQKFTDEKSSDEKHFSFSQKILPKTTSVQRLRYWIIVAAEMEPDVHLYISEKIIIY